MVFLYVFPGCENGTNLNTRSDVYDRKKSIFEYIKEIRSSWVINPRIRVQENNLKNKKKRRQEEKKMIKDGFK